MEGPNREEGLIGGGLTELLRYHCRKIQNYETVKGCCIPSQKKFKTAKAIKLR